MKYLNLEITIELIFYLSKSCRALTPSLNLDHSAYELVLCRVWMLGVFS